jgi:hypothetical protein
MAEIGRIQSKWNFLAEFLVFRPFESFDQLIHLYSYTFILTDKGLTFILTDKGETFICKNMSKLYVKYRLNTTKISKKDTQVQTIWSQKKFLALGK